MKVILTLLLSICLATPVWFTSSKEGVGIAKIDGYTLRGNHVWFNTDIYNGKVIQLPRGKYSILVGSPGSGYPVGQSHQYRETKKLYRYKTWSTIFTVTDNTTVDIIIPSGVININ